MQRHAIQVSEGKGHTPSNLMGKHDEYLQANLKNAGLYNQRQLCYEPNSCNSLQLQTRKVV
ncbi:hypothetical protein A9Q94_04155 [Rhodobacterales bacterium 56_14_T64]|nr:hypothetical protein A9Q94_04155 [Rhodobacterales bacterium 56_14_T64]